jgi:hypothetical protein
MTRPERSAPREPWLAVLTRRTVALVAFATLAAIAVAASTSGLLADGKRPVGLRWAAAGLMLVALAAAWRLAGGEALRGWRRLGAPRWALPAGLFTVFLAVKAVFAFGWATEQSSDFLSVHEAAQSINRGDYAFSGEAYWQFFAYQTPFAIYEAFMLKAFGGHLAPLLAVNVLAMAGTNLLVFFAARKLTGSAVAGVFASVAYLAYPGPLLLANVLTNDHISTFLLFLGAYMVLAGLDRSKGPRRWALIVGGGACLQFGNLARPAGVVVCAAVAAAALLAPVIRRRTGQDWRPLARSAVGAGVALVVYAAVGAGVGAAVAASGINPAGVGNNLPEWKFVVGLSVSGELESPADEIGTHEARPPPDAESVAKALLRRNFEAMPGSLPGVAVRQAVTLWGKYDTAQFMFWPQLADQPIYRVPDARRADVARYLVLGERGLFLRVVLLAAWGVALTNRERAWGRLAVFLGCFVAAYALVHLAIEAQPRYRYLVMPAVFALTGPAWTALLAARPSARASASLRRGVPARP